MDPVRDGESGDDSPGDRAAASGREPGITCFPGNHRPGQHTEQDPGTETAIRYRYTASVGIDLRKVILTPDGDRIVFQIPEPEILNDGIEALEVNKQDLFSRAVDKPTETLLEEQRKKCRDQYLTEAQHRDQIWESTKKAFDETLREWLAPYGEPQYEFEYRQIEKAL